MRYSFIIFATLLAGCASSSTLSKIDASAPDTKIDVRRVETPHLSAEERKNLFMQAHLFVENNACDKAYETLQTLHWDDPSDLTVHLKMGDCALALSNFQSAFEHYAQAPDSAPRLAGQTLVEIALGKTKTVERDINKAIIVNLADHRLWNARGRYQDSQGRWIEAVESYVQALRTGADRAPTINNMGVSLMMQGRYAEAREKFNQALSLKPGVMIFDNNRRLSFALEQNYDRAFAGLTPELSAILLNDAGYIALQNGHTTLARRMFEEALVLSPVHMPQAQANLDASKSPP
ncbi:tetratricopeptide repeat protein [Robiginitomaculum antarcticum]|uniref:tetratricopeptide repeat protein n=1 Tax=Robiginitomaculum antarcticum TaxID=437507 RepID=UPI00037C7302|nr:tetratricopeptide repeat protein [Robiginitomaculum antarcticum]